jgi:hypothetical protein
MAARDWEGVLIGFVLCLAGVFIASLIAIPFCVGWLAFTSGNTEYTVTITSVDGLDPAALEQRSDLSPVIGIAVRIDNSRYKLGGQCLGMNSYAVVSYGDAVLGKGTVPEFCACTLGVGEAAATAWGMDVQVPRFLRDRLAGELMRGEAVLDVAVRTPGNCHRCMDTVLVSKARIGGDPSPCLVTTVYQHPTPMDEL